MDTLLPTRRPWTNKDEATLKDFLKATDQPRTVAFLQVAALLDRSAPACKARAYKIGLNG